MKKKIKRKKYASGTSVKNYIENPSTELAQNQINLAQAKYEAESNPITNIMSALGNTAMQYGISKGGFGGSAAGKVGNTLLPVLGNMKFDMGGGVGNVPVEVEGKEVGELPNGKMLDFKGPSHENGGIPISLPEGTEIFSKRIKVKGKTMAERKKARVNKEMSLEKLLKKSPKDKILKATLKRTKANNEAEDAEDKKIQQMVSSMKQGAGFAMQGDNPEFKDGGTVMGNFLRDIFKNGQKADKAPKGVEFANMDTMPLDGDNTYLNEGVAHKDLAKGVVQPPSGEGANINPGDLVGLAGTLFSSLAPGQNTLKNRAGDTPNINAFENYGEDALKALDTSRDYIGQQRDNNLQNLELSKHSAIRRGRNSSRGVNSMRANDLATQQITNNAKSDIYSTFAQQMMQIATQQAGMENQQDQVVMQGEQTRDDNDRRDRDNFFSQMATDIGTKGEGIQRIGGMLNDIKNNKVSEEAVNSLSKYGFNFDSGGTLVDSKGTPVNEEKRNALAKLNGHSSWDEYIKSNSK